MTGGPIHVPTLKKLQADYDNALHDDDLTQIERAITGIIADLRAERSVNGLTCSYLGGFAKLCRLVCDFKSLDEALAPLSQEADREK